MIPEGDPDLTVYLNEFFWTNTPEQQSNTFWFPTPEIPGEIEKQTPMQLPIINELYELKLNPEDDTETRKNFLEMLLGDTAERHCWEKLLRKHEKQAIEDILVHYHDISARHITDIGINTKFMAKLTPKTTKMYAAKVYSSQSTW